MSNAGARFMAHNRRVALGFNPGLPQTPTHIMQVAQTVLDPQSEHLPRLVKKDGTVVISKPKPLYVTHLFDLMEPPVGAEPVPMIVQDADSVLERIFGAGTELYRTWCEPMELEEALLMAELDQAQIDACLRGVCRIPLRRRSWRKKSRF